MDEARHVSYGWTPLREILAEPNIGYLVSSYHQELWGEFRTPCEPDWEKRQAMEDAFVYRAWTMWVGGTLGGFIEWQVAPTINAKNTLFAIDCGHYIHPTYRSEPRLLYRMWSTAERALRDLGAEVVMVHDNIKRPMMPFFLARRYRPIGTLFMKRL